VVELRKNEKIFHLTFSIPRDLTDEEIEHLYGCTQDVMYSRINGENEVWFCLVFTKEKEAALFAYGVMKSLNIPFKRIPNEE